MLPNTVAISRIEDKVPKHSSVFIPSQKSTFQYQHIGLVFFTYLF